MVVGDSDGRTGGVKRRSSTPGAFTRNEHPASTLRSKSLASGIALCVAADVSAVCQICLADISPRLAGLD